MEDYKNKLGTLAERLKKQPPRTPVQEVHPVKGSSADKEAEAQLNTWIPKSLLKRMKAYGLEAELSLKEINILALKDFLDAKAPPAIP